MASDLNMPGMTTEAEIKYVCPMPSHAGILYDKPGNCPLCGMKLVPVHPWQMQQSPIIYWTCPMPEDYDVHQPGPGKCPKCGMTLIPVTQKEMERYKQIPTKALPVTLYTCPMPDHADVVSDKPGRCPKCDMKLVPTSSVPHGKQAEEKWYAEHPTVKPAPAPNGQNMQEMQEMHGMNHDEPTTAAQETTEIHHP